MKHTPVQWVAALALISLLGCAQSSEPVVSDRAAYPDIEPEAPVLKRLTRAQYHNVVRDLFGPDVTVAGQLEPDVPADGLLTVGASVTTISPRGVELYEDAARSLAVQSMETPERRKRVIDCTPSGPQDATCLEDTIRRFGLRAWRRPLNDDEVGRVLAVAKSAAEAGDSFEDGVSWAVVALLTSPNFLYRVEMGKDGRLTAFELASRLAFFLWNSGPDQALLDAAQAGELHQPDGLRIQAQRLLTDARSRDAVRNFFSEWLHLQQLDGLTKDPNVFKHYSPELGAMARDETLRLVEHLVFDERADIMDLFTTRTTFVNRRLAAIYNVQAGAPEGFARVELPQNGQRRGFLGQVSFLGLHSHPVSSSATLRGVFIREALLCEEVPDPPADLNTSIPQPSADAKTLRDRLLVHMSEPGCAGCHKFTDIVGLGFEQFDGLARFRLTELDSVIDPSGDLDGAEFADFSGLTQVLADDPRVSACLVEKLYSYALAQPIGKGADGDLDYLTADFVATGRDIQSLLLKVVLSEGFARVGEVAK